MKGQKGSMNIDFDEHYDEQDDIYYVTFRTGEPSFVKEVDDILLLEVGYYTGFPTGFRILNYSKHEIASIKVAKARVNSVFKMSSKNSTQKLNTSRRNLDTAINKFLQPA